jgi:hypothetical protein
MEYCGVHWRAWACRRWGERVVRGVVSTDKSRRPRDEDVASTGMGISRLRELGREGADMLQYAIVCVIIRTCRQAQL